MAKVLGPSTDFPTCGSGKGTEYPQGIWHWRPEGFDYRTPTGLGKQSVGGHNKILCTPGPREKEQWPHKSLSPTCLWVSRSLCGGVCWQGPAVGSGARLQQSWDRSMLEQALLKEVTITAITPTIVWPNYREGTQPHPSAENWVKDLLSMTLPTRARPSFPTASPSHQGASTSLLSLSIKGQTEWKPQSQKTNQTDHMDHSLVWLNEIMNCAV